MGRTERIETAGCMIREALASLEAITAVVNVLPSDEVTEEHLRKMFILSGDSFRTVTESTRLLAAAVDDLTQISRAIDSQTERN